MAMLYGDDVVRDDPLLMMKMEYYWGGAWGSKPFPICDAGCENGAFS